MSAFLGPIHYWLYHKIKIQEELTQKVLSHLKSESYLSINQQIKDHFDCLPVGDLEEVIDNQHIHEWLQSKVTLVEQRYAFAISEILNKAYLTVEEIEAIAYKVGKKWAPFDLVNVQSAYRFLNDHLLDGMPCDRINQVVNETSYCITFKRQKCIHKSYWEKYGQSGELYYKLREAFVQGLLTYSPVTYKATDGGEQCLEVSGISLLKSEHQIILEAADILRALCLEIIEQKPIPFDALRDIVDFVQNYADAHHHAKEEKYLFEVMETDLGKIGSNLIRHGMLVEHDLGRLHIKELAEALDSVCVDEQSRRLDLVGHGVAYVHLIKRHIEKEDALIFAYGEKHLAVERLNEVNQQTLIFEASSEQVAVRENYCRLIKKLQENRSVSF